MGLIRTPSAMDGIDHNFLRRQRDEYEFANKWLGLVKISSAINGIGLSFLRRFIGLANNFLSSKYDMPVFFI